MTHGADAGSDPRATQLQPQPRAERSVGRNIAALSGGQIVTWTMTLLWTFVVPRELGPGDLGLIVSGWAVAGVLGTLLGLGTRQYVVRQIVLNPNHAPRLIGTAVVLRLCLTPLFLAAVVGYVGHVRYSSEGRLVVYLAAGATILNLLADPFQAGFQAFERMEYLAYSDVINKSAQGLLGVVLALAGFRSVGLTACWLVVAGVVVVANALWMRPLSAVDGRTSTRAVLDMARQSVSYWAFGLFFMVYLWIDSVLLSLMTTPEVVGWYGVPTRLFQTLMFLPVMVSTAWLPRLVAAHDAGPEAFHQMARRPVAFVLAASLPLAGAVVVGAPPVIDVLYGPEYHNAIPVLVVLGLCLPFMYVNTMLGAVVIAEGRQCAWTWVMAGATCVNPVVNIVLIRVMDRRYGNGAIGAAVSLVITEVVMVVAGLVVARLRLTEDGFLRRFAAGTAASAALVAAGLAARPLGSVTSLVVAAAAFTAIALSLHVVTPADVKSARRLVLQTVPRLRRRDLPDGPITSVAPPPVAARQASQ